MKRRSFLKLAALTGAAAVTQPTQAKQAASIYRIKPFELEEATLMELQAAMASGKETAVSLAKKYLERIEQIDHAGPNLNSTIELNPDALRIARDLDRERKAKGPRGPLHGIPVLLKDNIDTGDRMMTTAGSLALLGSIAPRDAFIVQQLRHAGVVILGKTNLSEWANFRGERSTSGWSGRGGLTKNPYALDRNPSGSSSGSAAAVSANLCALAVGTETNGSIVSPSSLCGIVGIKPTVGLLSRSGIIPISHSQDTAGPMARTVRDAAIMLGAMTGIDSRDSATQTSAGNAQTDYTTFLDPNGLKGARLGVARRYFRSGRRTDQIMESCIETMKSRGAIIVEPFDDKPLADVSSGEGEVLLHEFKADLNAYLAMLGDKAPIRTLKDAIAFNEANKEKELCWFGQETFLKAQEKGPLTDKAYLDALEKCRRLARTEGIDALMDKYKLDAIVAPAGGPAGKTDLVFGDRGVGGSSSPAAVAGYPNITIPAGDVLGLPMGISFFGRAYSEPTLLRIAYAFEQTTKARIVPKFLQTIG